MKLIGTARYTQILIPNQPASELARADVYLNRSRRYRTGRDSRVQNVPVHMFPGGRWARASKLLIQYLKLRHFS